MGNRPVPDPPVSTSLPQELGSNGGDLVSRDGRPGAAMQISVVPLAIFTLFVTRW